MRPTRGGELSQKACEVLIGEVEAEVVVADFMGSSVTAQLDMESEVAWIGYANRRLQEYIDLCSHN